MSEFFDDMKIAVLQAYSYQIICTKETKFAHMNVGGMKAKQKREKTGKGQEHRNPFFTFQMTSLTMAMQRAHTSNGMQDDNYDAGPSVPGKAIPPPHGKYRGWNGSTVEISFWADLDRQSAGIKNSPKNLCSHVIFIVFFKLELEIAGGDGINQFLLKIRAF